MRRLGAVVAALAVALLLLVAGAPAASAHVLPTSTVQLDVHESDIDAAVAIPLADLESASGIVLADESQASVDANAAAITAYLLAHFAPTSDDGSAWAVTVGALTVTQAGDTVTTGLYAQLTTTFVLTPPAGDQRRSFDLGYDIVVDREVTHVVLVTVRSDWAGGDLGGAREIGTIRLDTVTDTVPSLHVDLGDASLWSGFAGMVTLGVQHIQQGTDHQLFLLTLLLPAPLVARGRRWASVAPVKTAVRRIASITLAFTVGHSITLALGAMGLPVPAGLIEVLIAASILVAAVHALRPIFAGREVLIAGLFGLVHGLAFSETLRELDLTGVRLALSLLGFNLGIEAMQLAVVALVLPPLIVLSRTRTRRYSVLRAMAAVATAVAAVGWLVARIGFANPVATMADAIGVLSIPVVAGLWLAALGAALGVMLSRRRAERVGASAPPSRASVAHEQPRREGEPACRDAPAQNRGRHPTGDARADQSARDGTNGERPHRVPHHRAEHGEQHGRQNVGDDENHVLQGVGAVQHRLGAEQQQGDQQNARSGAEVAVVQGDAGTRGADGGSAEPGAAALLPA
ncbi:HupE/UreJ family protein [Subtercola sp. YIM 133946]